MLPPAAASPPAAAAPPAAGEGGAPPNASLAPSLACFGCARLPSEMGDGREKHPVCPICVKLKVPTTYWCCVNCPANPAAYKVHAVYHKAVKRRRNRCEDGGVMQQRDREVAEEQARYAAQTGDEYDELMAEGARYASQRDTRRAARAAREAIALEPDEPDAPGRDVFNEKPSKEDLALAEREARGPLPRQATINTSYGEVRLKLFPDECPKTIENFCTHARQDYYNGIIFHRVIKGFMLQARFPRI